MYYRLKEPWTFSGWKRTPHAVTAAYGPHKQDKPFFIDKAVFIELLYCNGEEDMDINDFSDTTRKIISEFIEHDMMESSPEKMKPLEPWQRYHVFPSRYIGSVHWSITGKCNFNCRHCLVSAPDAHHPQLPLKDCLHIIDQIAICGVRRVDITGGEPLVRGDFEQIVKALSERNIDIGVLFTNASLLNEDIINLLMKYNQHPTMQLSFDGLGQHDWLRGVPGAEEQADKAFRLLKKYHVPVSAAMCIHKGNMDTLRDTIKYLSELDVKSLRVNSPQELGVWKQYSEKYALSEEEVWDVYRRNIEWYFEDGMPLDLELDGYFRCKKGSTDYKISWVHTPPEDIDWHDVPHCESMRHLIYIGADGRLAPCMAFADSAMKDKFPSVLEAPLGELTLSGAYYDVVNQRISDFLEVNEECRNCEHLRACCGGCMAEGMSKTGSCLSKDDRCCYFHKNIGEKAVRDTADKAIEKLGLKRSE